MTTKPPETRHKGATAPLPPLPDDWAEHALEMSNDQLMAYYDQPRAVIAAWRKRTGLHRPRGRRALPVAAHWDQTLGLAELARAYGWGSAGRFAQRLRERRPAIYAIAYANSQLAKGRRKK